MTKDQRIQRLRKKVQEQRQAINGLAAVVVKLQQAGEATPQPRQPVLRSIVRS